MTTYEDCVACTDCGEWLTQDEAVQSAYSVGPLEQFVCECCERTRELEHIAHDGDYDDE